MGIADTYAGRELPLSPAAIVAVVAVLALLGDLGVRIAVGAQSVSQLVGFVWNGLVVGAVIGLAGIGLSLTYSILGFANFGHGDYLTTGAFAGWVTTFLIAGFGRFDGADLALVQGISTGESGIGIAVTTRPGAILVGLVVAALATVVLALAIDRVVYRPMRDQEGIALLIASIGVALAVRYGIAFVFGQGRRGLTATDAVPSASLYVVDGPVSVNAHEVTLLACAVGLMAGVHVLLQRTKLGKAMRAMADNEDLARVTGIPTERVVRYTWIIGAALAGAGGYLIALESGTLGFNLGWLLLLLIFSAVILGGIGSVYGAIVGGLVIGIADNVALVWLPGSLTRVAAFLLLIAVLLYRPAGLFGGTTTA